MAEETNIERRTLIEQLDNRNIGPNVYSGSISRDTMNDIIAICRRRFKRTDVIVYVDTDENEEYESGIVFTEDCIYEWSDNGSSINEVLYQDIESVEFDETEVTMRTGNGEITLYLGEDAEEENYSRHMYNFIMDIIENDYSDIANESYPLRTELMGNLLSSFTHVAEKKKKVGKVMEQSSQKNNIGREKWVKDCIMKALDYQEETEAAMIDCILHIIALDRNLDITEESIKKLERYLKNVKNSSIKSLCGEAFDFIELYFGERLKKAY